MRRRIEELLGISSGRKTADRHLPSSFALSQGTLFFFFALILLGLEAREFDFFGHTIPAFPISFHKSLGIVALTASTLLMIATFSNRASVGLERLLGERPTSAWRFVLQYTCWVMFWLVYSAGWIHGLSNIPAQERTFHVAFWIGTIWFFIIPLFFIEYMVYLHRER